MPLLIALGIFYAIGRIFTANPWLTVLKIWLGGWLICAIFNCLWLFVEQSRLRKDDEKNASPPVKDFFVKLIVNGVLSIWMTVFWPSFLYGEFQDVWIKLAVRLGIRPPPPPEKEPRRKANVKAVRDTENIWQLEGESNLGAITIPNSPVSGTPTIVRLTHDNSYGPFDEVDFFVRVGDPNQPTDEFDLKSHNDWIKAQLVEEIVNVDGDDFFRSEVKDQEPFDDETPWEGTYEVELMIPQGKRLIEIKIVSRRPKIMESRVLSDWEVTVTN